MELICERCEEKFENENKDGETRPSENDEVEIVGFYCPFCGYLNFVNPDPDIIDLQVH